MTDLDARVERWVRQPVRALQAYHVPPARGLVKLDAMENPYSWPESLRDDWGKALQAVDVNRYPDPQATELRGLLRGELGLHENQGLLLGNGSDELIQLLAMAVAGPERCLMAPEPSFVMYRMIACFTGLGYQGVPLRDGDFSLDADLFCAQMQVHQPALVFLAVPNNPTGNAFPEAEVRRVIEAAPGVVVLDEAYVAFAGGSLRHLLDEYQHVLLMRTLSKEGLAGLRLGMLAGASAWTDELEKLRLPYNVNVLSQAAASFALRHREVLHDQTARICQQRAELLSALRGLDSLTVWDSAANFLLFRTRPGFAQQVHAGLREAGVLIKCLDGSHPMLSDCLRVTVGTPEENQAFLAALGPLL